jgi:hypothetical protein
MRREQIDIQSAFTLGLDDGPKHGISSLGPAMK